MVNLKVVDAQALQILIVDITALPKVWWIVEQSKHKKAHKGQPKPYGWHAPKISGISEGRARWLYEFGVKVGIATTSKANFVVGAGGYAGDPC